MLLLCAHRNKLQQTNYATVNFHSEARIYVEHVGVINATHKETILQQYFFYRQKLNAKKLFE